jgi:hypothetical protein
MATALTVMFMQSGSLRPEAVCGSVVWWGLKRRLKPHHDLLVGVARRDPSATWASCSAFRASGFST